MSPRRLALLLVLAVVAASVGVGASTPGVTDPAAVGAATTPTGANETAPAPLGQSISSMMQASAAQAAGSVENGMWAAAYANASNASEKRALVERRYDQLDSTLAEVRAERQTLQAQFRNGTINRTTYLARLSTIVGRLAAAGEGIESAGERGAEVGVNASRLDELRSTARNLSGAEVSRLARNLTGGPGQPGPPGLFGEDRPGKAGDRGPGDQSNASNRSSGNGQPTDAGNRSQAENTSQSGNEGGSGDAGSAGGSGNGQGPPSDAGDGRDEGATETPTETDTGSDY